jgi:hypothetical protein
MCLCREVELRAEFELAFRLEYRRAVGVRVFDIVCLQVKGARWTVKLCRRRADAGMLCRCRLGRFENM